MREESLLFVGLLHTLVGLFTKGDFCDLELSDKLLHSHYFVEFEVDGCDKLGPHHSIKHLVEVDEAVVHTDAHLEDDPVDFILAGGISDTEQSLHSRGKLAEHLRDVLHLDLDTLISICGGLLPGNFEVVKVVFETREWVVILQVVLAELLDNDQNEKVEHDVGHDHVEEDVEQRSDFGAA